MELDGINMTAKDREGGQNHNSNDDLEVTFSYSKAITVLRLIPEIKKA